MCESKWDKSKLFHPDYDASGGNAFKRLGTSTARYGCCPANKYMTKPFLNEDTFNPDNSCNSACPAGKFGTTQSGLHDNICQLCERGKSSNAGSTSCDLTTVKMPDGCKGKAYTDRSCDPRKAVDDMDAIGTCNFVKILRYGTVPYQPTSAKIGSLDSSGFAKLSDTVINNILPDNDGYYYYKLEDLDDTIFVRTKSTFHDQSRSFGWPSLGYNTCHNAPGDVLTGCSWGGINLKPHFETSSTGNDCSRWFNDYYSAGQCFNGGSGRCFSAGKSCGDHKMRQNVIMSKLDCSVASKKEIATKKYGPIENWDMSLVTDISNLFSQKGMMNADLSSWDVSRVTNMYAST